MNDNSENHCQLERFLSCCENSIGEVLSQALATRWRVTRSYIDFGEVADLISLAFSVSQPLIGRIFFTVRRADALRLAQAFLGLTSDAGQWNDETREAVEELFRQIAGHFADGLRQSFDEVRLQFCPDEQRALAGVTDVPMAATATDGPTVPILLQISPDLMHLMSGAPPVPPVATSSTELSRSRVRGENLELLMGIELRATLRFGRKRMPLHEVLDLSAGSVIELDRQVQDPVDLLLDDKIIARGEVVIVDGCYGLRVTEVASQRARAECVR